MITVGGLIEMAQERDRLQVFLAAEFIGNPFAGAAAVVEIKHGCYCGDPQAVDVILVEPEQRTAREEVTHFVATVIEDGAVPFGVKAALGVGVLILISAVEIT